MTKRDEEHEVRKVLRTDAMEKEDRTTENKMEGRMPTRVGNYWTRANEEMDRAT